MTAPRDMLSGIAANSLPGNEIVFSFGKNKFDNQPQTRVVDTFDDLRSFIDSTRRRKKGLGYICAPFSDGHRGKDTVMPSRLLMLDADKIDASIIDVFDAWACGHKGVAWATHSSTSAAPRRRAVLLLDRPVNREEMSRIGAALSAEIVERWGDRIGVDASVFRAEQPNYLAPVGVNLIDLEGQELCADEWLARPAAIAHSYDGGGRSAAARAEAAASKDPVAKVLDERGFVKGFDAPRGRFAIDCPFSDEHTGESGDTSTIYYLPNFGGHEHGNFKCLHAHCADRKTDDFLRKLGLDPQQTRTQQRTGFTAVSADEIAAQRERSKNIGRENTRGVPEQRLMSLPAMIAELVLIADGSRVSFVDNPAYTLSYSDFRAATGGSFDMVESKRGGARKVYCLDQWRDHKDRMTVTTQTFAPGRPIVCQSPEDKTAQNLWIAKNRKAPENWQDIVGAFLDHVAYLVPIESERERFLDWLAHIEKRPGELPSTHYLFTTEQTGIGRNWLSYALARVHSRYTALGFDLAASLHSGFNDELGGKLLAVVDELHAGGPNATRAPNAEKLKSMLTEHTRTINPKYGRVRVEYNCCRFLMFSNHEAALPLSDNDRRVVVIANPTERRSPAYYRELYRLLDVPGFGDALARWFRERDITRFNPGEIAPMNDAKKRTIRAGRSEIEQAIRDIAEDWPSACITSGRLSMEVRLVLGDRVNSTQGPCVAAGLMKYGQVRVDGKRNHVWILRDVSKWQGEPPAIIAGEVIRGEDAANSANGARKDAAGVGRSAAAPVAFNAGDIFQ